MNKVAYIRTSTRKQTLEIEVQKKLLKPIIQHFGSLNKSVIEKRIESS